MYKNMQRFNPHKNRIDAGKPSGPDPLMVAHKRIEELTNKIAELETLISSMAPDAETVEVVLEKPAKKKVVSKKIKKGAA